MQEICGGARSPPSNKDPIWFCRQGTQTTLGYPLPLEKHCTSEKMAGTISSGRRQDRPDRGTPVQASGCPPPHPRMVTSGPQPPESGAVPAEVAAGTSGHPETGQGAPLTTKRCLLSYHPFTHHEKHTCIFNKYNSVK